MEEKKRYARQRDPIVVEIAGETYIDVHGMAEKFKTTPNTINQRVREGILPKAHIKNGKHPLWSLTKVREFFEKQIYHNL